MAKRSLGVPKKVASPRQDLQLLRDDWRQLSPQARDSFRSAVGFPISVGKWQLISDCLALSRRESQIARLVLDDVPTEDIASQLLISPSTVHAHVERMYRKLRVHSRHQLVIRIFSTYLSILSPDQR